MVMFIGRHQWLKETGLFFKMSSFGLHHGLETLQGGATRGTDLFLADGVPRWRQGGLQMVDTAEGFIKSACGSPV